jgi:4-hydroxybenzoate polyprenyltransferase
VAGIGLGLWTGVVWFGPQILGCFLVMLVINLAYSSGGRNLRYVDLLLNSLPHVVRLSMGALLVGRIAPIGHLASFLCLAIAMSCLRRDVEREATGVTGRSTLERYGPRELDAIVVTCLAMLVTLGVTVGETAPGFYVVLFSSAFVLLGGGYFVPAIRSVLAAVWVR